MDKELEKKELGLLMKAKLRPYTVDTFKKYWTHEDDYKSKKAGPVNRIYIAVYSIWHKRLLARVFYFEEYMRYKKISRQLFEVQRQVAGMSEKISCRIYSSMSEGFRVWTYRDARGWKTSSATTYRLYGVVNNWTGNQDIRFTQYNDPLPYLKKSVQKYSGYEYLPVTEREHNYMFEYLLKYEKHPQIEMLAKLGLFDIINDLTGIRWSKKGIAMLGITKQELPYLQAGMTLKEYRSIKDWCKRYKFTPAEAKTALRYLAYERKYRAYIPSRPLIPFESRLIRYVTAHDIDFIEYKDHLKMIEKLGLPREQKYLYPDDFRTVHEELVNRIRFENQKALREKAERRRAEAEKMIMKKDGYVIKPLLMPKELREEGKKMHHCVGSYAEKVATGECLIFSVRKEEDIERPLATIEIQEKKVKQVRAAYNNEPPEDVSVFVKKWEKKFRLSGW